MTYLEVLKILRKHRILIVGKILDKRNSVNNDRFSEDKELKFSFIFFKRIGREEFERIGIDVGSRCDIGLDISIKYLSIVLKNFSDKIMYVDEGTEKVLLPLK